MLAISALSPEIQSLFFFAALVLFVVAAVLGGMRRVGHRTLVPAGLACIAFVWFWTALAAS